MSEPTRTGFWRRYQRALILAALPAWVLFIVLVYAETRPQDAFGAAAYTLKVGALPVT